MDKKISMEKNARKGNLDDSQDLINVFKNKFDFNIQNIS
jgi:hypothetical protein